jgi:F-type H+-transporting ATPase subunit b
MEGLAKLGIDFKAILIYMVNTGFLIVILWYFLYNPILNFIEGRQKKIADTINEADLIKSEFEKRLAEMEAEKAKAQAELKSELEKMEKFVESKKAELIASMEAERNTLIEKTSAEMEKRKAELVKEAESRLLEIIKKIVLEIVRHKVPSNVIAESVNEAWKQYKK